MAVCRQKSWENSYLLITLYRRGEQKGTLECRKWMSRWVTEIKNLDQIRKQRLEIQSKCFLKESLRLISLLLIGLLLSLYIYFCTILYVNFEILKSFTLHFFSSPLDFFSSISYMKLNLTYRPRFCGSLPVCKSEAMLFQQLNALVCLSLRHFQTEITLLTN